MDYHFVNARFEDSNKNAPIDLAKLTKVLFRFIPVLVLALFLPFFLMFTLTPPELNFLTRADSEPEIRLWFEPSQVVVTSGQEVKLKIMAEFNNERDLIPGISFDLDSVGNMSLSNRRFDYEKPFRGQAVVGELTVIPNQAGQMFVKIPMGLVTLKSYPEELKIITSQARLVVQ